MRQFSIIKSEFSTVAKCNQDNLSRLIEIQEKTGEGCFFVGLYSLSAALYPEKSLPESHEYLSDIRTKYSHLLEKNKLLINYSEIIPALKIYKDWDIKLKCLSMNKAGESIIGKYIKDQAIPTCSIPTWDSLDSNQISVPHSILVHQAGCNNSHYITIDGSKKAEELKEKYFNDGYRTIVIFEFLPNTIYDVVQERGTGDGHVTLVRAV